ncbi:hypothetical protein MY4824_005441 [Beauveria thailandica]
MLGADQVTRVAVVNGGLVASQAHLNVVLYPTAGKEFVFLRIRAIQSRRNAVDPGKGKSNSRRPFSCSAVIYIFKNGDSAPRGLLPRKLQPRPSEAEEKNLGFFTVYSSIAVNHCSSRDD